MSLRVMKMRVGADVGAFVKPLVDAVPKARLCWDRWHPVIVSKAIAVLVTILEAHVTAADVLYNEAKGTILKLEEQGVNEAEIMSRRDQLAPLGRVFQHEQRRRESVEGFLRLAAEAGPRRRSVASGTTTSGGTLCPGLLRPYSTRIVGNEDEASGGRWL
jgi:hypothetical protein